MRDGHNQELALPILLPASGCEQPARGSSGAPGAPCFQMFSILTALTGSGQFLLPGSCFPDPGSRVGKIGKTDVRKDLSLLAPSEVRYPAGLAGVIKSSVIIYPRASLASHVPRSKSGNAAHGNGFTRVRGRAQFASPGFNPPLSHRSAWP